MERYISVINIKLTCKVVCYVQLKSSYLFQFQSLITFTWICKKQTFNQFFESLFYGIKKLKNTQQPATCYKRSSFCQ